MRILLIDDCERIHRILTPLLTALNFELASASDGVEGLRLLESFAPDFVITDVNMPRMDGLAFIEQARRTKAGRDVPIIVLSSDRDPRQFARARQFGIRTWLQKPINTVSLTAALAA